MMVTKHLFVEGLVQGVGFRYHTQQKAKELGILGWVRNLSDGRVELFAHGNEIAVGKLLEWLNQGPPRARVDKVLQNDESPVQKFNSFEVV